MWLNFFLALSLIFDLLLGTLQATNHSAGRHNYDINDNLTLQVTILFVLFSDQ